MTAGVQQSDKAQAATVPSATARPQIEHAVTQILIALGEDPDREGLRETPARVARMYLEVMSGLWDDPFRHLETQFDIGPRAPMSRSGPIIIKDIPFHSMCEHHLLPFFGWASICYLPDGDRVAGLSKFARVIESFARRPQMQERLTSGIADVIADKLQPRGVLVLLEAEHMCMAMRGVRSNGSLTRTLASRGIYETDSVERSQILELVRDQRRGWARQERDIPLARALQF